MLFSPLDNLQICSDKTCRPQKIACMMCVCVCVWGGGGGGGGDLNSSLVVLQRSGAQE